MYLGVVLEQFAEIEKKYFSSCRITAPSHPPCTTRLIPSPPLVEAASGIIYSAPVLGIRGMHSPGVHTGHLLTSFSTELQTARDVLIQRLGKEFSRAAAGNKDRYVSSRVRSHNYTPHISDQLSPRSFEQFWPLPHQLQCSTTSSPGWPRSTASNGPLAYDHTRSQTINSLYVKFAISF